MNLRLTIFTVQMELRLLEHTDTIKNLTTKDLVHFYFHGKEDKSRIIFYHITMLSNNHKLEDINSELGDSYRLAETNPMDIRQIQDLEIKTKIQSLYVYDGQYVTTNNPEGIDYVRLLEVIKDIPASEISEDIEKMYNFIVSKIN